MAATAVTPTGVRDGDPDALAGLCDVRGPAVLAYCEVVAGRGERGAAAAAEAMGSFRAGVVLAGDLATLNPESLLISATRHAAARQASGEVPPACARVPGLLAARADRSISLADHDWLEEHLETCWTCRAPVARFNVADQAYSQPPDTPLPPAVKAAMVEAMTVAAPVLRDTAGTPAEVRQNTNGHAAHPEPEAPEEPYTAYDLPALEAPGADEHASATPDPRAGGGAALPRPRRERSRHPTRRLRERGLRPAVVLPVALVVIAIIAALAIAGVFGGGEPASAPQSFAPAAGDARTSTQAPRVVVVPGAASASAAAVEKAKARARTARKKAAAATDENDAATKAPTPAAATAPPAATAGATPLPAPPPPPPPPPASSTNRPSSSGKPKIDAGNGATGAEQLPPAKDTSTVPDLAPPVQPAPPPG